GVGDETFKKKASKVMKDKIRSDKTVVLVSHSAGTIKELCDAAVWIESGISRSEGPAGKVLDEYNAFLKAKSK
ncbi:MAG: ABC transporter ATP-binding protein, partial [Desulfonatronovibrionaceae bacterium]